jgi:hypothetical protein
LHEKLRNSLFFELQMKQTAISEFFRAGSQTGSQTGSRR